MFKKIFLIIISISLFSSCRSYKVDEDQKRFLLNDTGKDKYFLVEFIIKNNAEKILGTVPTLIINKIDGQLIVRSDKEFVGSLSLKKSDIKRIVILDIEKSIGLYGSAGKNGVINIFTYSR